MQVPDSNKREVGQWWTLLTFFDANSSPTDPWNRATPSARVQEHRPTCWPSPPSMQKLRHISKIHRKVCISFWTSVLYTSRGYT